jgi:acyl transferase domain-containing protein
VQALLPPAIAIAAINSPGLTVVSGASAEVDAFAEMLSGNGIAATMLVTSHAYHSAMMAPARAPLVEAVAAVPRKPAALSIVSTALARAVAPDALCDPAYWGEQLMSPVRFADSVAAAPDAGVLLEVGPGRTLATLARQCLGGRAGRAPVACLGPVQAPGSDVASLLSAVGQLWLAGAMPDWEAFQPGRRIRVALPTYPFERKRFWVQPMQMDTGAAAPAGGNHATAALPGAAVATPEAGFATDVEQLIQQQLLLISEQIGAMAKAGTDDK